MEFFQILEKLNWQGIISIFAVNWFFSREIKNQITKLDQDLREQGKRTDQLYQMFVDLLKNNKT